MNEFKNAERSIPCDYCRAAKGEPCRTPKGRVTYTHAVRDHATRDAFFWGYEAGLRDAVEHPDVAEAQLRFFVARHAEQEVTR